MRVSVEKESVVQMEARKDALNLVRIFLKFKSVSGSAPRTCYDYKAVLRLFFSLYPSALDSPVSMRESFIDWMSSGDWATATYNKRLNYIRCFWKWCVEEEAVPSSPNPFRGLETRRDAGKFKDIKASRIQELLTLPDVKTWVGLRNLALIMFTIDTATRPSEALSLKLEDFDFENLSVTISSKISKTREQRTIPFSVPTMKMIRKLIRNRNEEWGESVPVFCSFSGRTLRCDDWYVALRHYRLSDGTFIRPYELRHASCTLHLRAGMTGEVLQRFMGHRGPQMTQRYIHLTSDDLREAQSKTSPIEALMRPLSRAKRRTR